MGDKPTAQDRLFEMAEESGKIAECLRDAYESVNAAQKVMRKTGGATITVCSHINIVKGCLKELATLIKTLDDTILDSLIDLSVPDLLFPSDYEYLKSGLNGRDYIIRAGSERTQTGQG